MNQGEPAGYRITLNTAISSPITIGGVPRMIAIAIGTLTMLLSMSLQQPWFGVPMGVLLWACAYAATKSDPYFFKILDRHIRHTSHWDG